MGTSVEYNGILMTNVVTREWSQSMVYDASHTDLLYSKFRLTFEGIIHGESTTVLGTYAAAAGVTPPKITHQLLSRQLQTPRHKLSVWMGPDNQRNAGTLFFEILPYNISDTASATQYDVETGPKPIEVKITHVVGYRVFRVLFTIECAKIECENGSIPPQNGHVLNNKWRIEEDMDANFFTTRTIAGTLRLATCILPGNAFKQLVLPRLETGFRRDAIQYVVSENGLDCNYTVRDKQVHTAAPWPATDISGTHTESTNDGKTFFADMSVRLEGSPEADKADLLQRCVQIVDSRLHLIEHQNQDSPKYFIAHAAITDHIGAGNAIEMQVKIQRMPPGDAAGADDIDLGEYLTNVVVESFGTRLELPPLRGNEYDARKSRLPALYGYDPQTGERSPSAALFMLHGFLQTPCSDQHSHQIDQNVQSPSYDAAQYDTGVTGSTASHIVETSNTESQYSAETHESVYTYYELQNTYGIQAIRVQAPYAVKVEPYEDTSKVFLLGSGRAYREIKLEAERVGSWPQVPEPKDEYSDGYIKGWLLDHKEFTQPPTLSADGRHKLYKIEATYRWALNRFPQPGEATHTGVLAFTKYTQDENALQRDGIYLARLDP